MAGESSGPELYWREPLTIGIVHLPSGACAERCPAPDAFTAIWHRFPPAWTHAHSCKEDWRDFKGQTFSLAYHVIKLDMKGQWLATTTNPEMQMTWRREIPFFGNLSWLEFLPYQSRWALRHLVLEYMFLARKKDQTLSRPSVDRICFQMAHRKIQSHIGTR